MNCDNLMISDCTATWTAPSDTSTAYVRSIGAPTTLTVSYSGVALADGAVISFLTGTVSLYNRCN